MNNQNCLIEGATHVVTETTYGCDTILEFTKRDANRAEERQIMGELKAKMDKVSIKSHRKTRN